MNTKAISLPARSGEADTEVLMVEPAEASTVSTHPEDKLDGRSYVLHFPSSVLMISFDFSCGIKSKIPRPSRRVFTSLIFLPSCISHPFASRARHLCR